VPIANSSLPQRSLLAGGNALKIGLFGANCSSGRAVTKVPERWSGTWADNLRRADRNGRLGSIDRMMQIKNLTPQTLGDNAFAEKRMYLASARSAAIRSSARPTASPANWPT